MSSFCLKHFCASIKLIFTHYKWGWRPYAADPWDQLAQTRFLNAKKGPIGPAAGSPECQTLSERRETSCKPCFYLPFCTASFQMACCVLQVAFAWHTSGPKDAAAAPKHHGSEGRIGPAASSPECQTWLSERLETSCKPCLYLPFGTASFQSACCVCFLNA